MMISSPALTLRRPQVLLTRLTPSVVPRTKMSSSLVRAFRKRRALDRVSSYAAVERCESSCTPRWMLAQSTSWKRRHFDPVHHILREGVGQEAARLTLANTARLKVEQSFRIQLPDSGAMGAAHVIGPDL